MHNLISPNVLGALLCCAAIVANVYYSIIIAKKFRLEHRYIRLSICLISVSYTHLRAHET